MSSAATESLWACVLLRLLRLCLPKEPLTFPAVRFSSTEGHSGILKLGIVRNYILFSLTIFKVEQRLLEFHAFTPM